MLSFTTVLGAGTLWERFYQNFIQADRYRLYLDGLGVTMLVSVMAVVLGIVLGVALALMRLSHTKVLSKVAGAYIDVIRGTPMVVQLMIFYFIIFGSVRIDRVLVGAIAFGCNSGAYVAEIVRAGILSIDKGQTEAGRTLGLSSGMTMRLIVLPQALKNILPALGNELIVLVKETSVLGYIGAVDLAKVGEQMRARTFDAFMPLIGVAIIYYVIVKIMSILLQKMERRLRESDIR